MRLGRRDRCPLHHRFDCCGRAAKKKSPIKSTWVKIGPGTFKIDDPHHPRGYRVRRSKSAMKKLVIEKVGEQENLCCDCGKPFTDMAEVTPEHLTPRGIGAAWRDDHEDNIGAAHSWCNVEKGSRRIPNLAAQPAMDFEVKPSGEIVEDVFGKPATKRIQ